MVKTISHGQGIQCVAKYPKYSQIYQPNLSAHAQNYETSLKTASLDVRSPCLITSNLFNCAQLRFSILQTGNSSNRKFNSAFYLPTKLS